MGYFEDVQKAVRLIPYGKVATYAEVARGAGHPGTARQVAWALRDRTALELPWQRVVGHGGRILLQEESGKHQRRLLEREGVGFRGSRVDMNLHEFRFSRAKRRK
jgi:methylated-DNA-protein-cysteine methyltransferase related protein